MRYSQLDTAVENLFRKLPKLETNLGAAKQANKIESFKNNDKELSILNKYSINPNTMSKKDDQKKLMKLPKDAKELKNIDLKPSIQRLPNVEAKKILKPLEKSEIQELRTDHKDIDVLKKIQQIKDLLEMGKQDSQNPKDVEYYKKSEIAKKRYLSTLSTMQQRLKEIEYKYFTLPSILNRTMKTFNKPAKDISIAAKESRSHKKVKIEETTSSESVKESEKPKKKPKVVVKETIKYADAFLPKREAPIPPTFILKPNTSGSLAKNKTLSKEKTTIDGKKPNKLQLIKKNQELNPKPPKATKNIEMLFSKDYQAPANPEIVPKKTTNFNIPSPKGNYLPPPFIQKIRHPELFPKIPSPTQVKGTKIVETSPQSTSRLSEMEVSDRPVGQHVQKKITFNISRSAMKKHVDTLKPVDNLKPINRTTELMDHYLKEKGFNSGKIGSRYNPYLDQPDLRKTRYSDQLWIANKV